MYEIGKTYKFELVGRFFYTGKVLEEDALNVKIRTIRDEVIILSKSKVKQSLEYNPLNR